MASFQEQLAQINRLRTAQSQADQKAYSEKLAIRKSVATANNGEVVTALKNAEATYRSAGNSLNEAIKNLHALDIRTLTKELNGNIPIVLFPVRIETRFVSPPVTPSDELWIRIFPDDIHTNAHEPALTREEITTGETYWKELAQIAAQSAEPTAKKKI